jgi:hypothetical protein
LNLILGEDLDLQQKFDPETINNLLKILAKRDYDNATMVTK